MRHIRTILIVLAGGALALALDMPMHRFVAAYVQPHLKDSLVHQVIVGFQDFAQLVPIVMIAWAVLRLDRRQGRQVVVRMVVAAVLAGLLSSGAKAIVGRHRPEHFKGNAWSQSWVDFGWKDRSGKQESFFSGHSGAAFAIATVLGNFYPPLRPIVTTLAIGCAASRMATQQHWASDVYVGSGAGIVVGWLLLPAALRRGRRGKGLLQGRLPAQAVGTSSNG